MSVVKRNIVANFAGNLWTAVMSLAFIPLYIHFMGIEAYGLVGVFVTLQALTVLLDMGLSSTLNREMARLSVEEHTGRHMRDLLRTLEVVFWTVALLIGVVLLVLAPWLARDWLRVEALSPETTRQAIVLMGVALALNWPSGLYTGGLLGLQRQVLYNGILVVSATLRGVGAVLVLWLVSPTAIAFFTWQLIISVLQTGLSALCLWRSLPAAPGRTAFRAAIFRGIWRFAAGMSGITVLAVVLMQLDKIILSRLLSLEMFGYYMLAAMAAASLYRLTSPVFSALYPRFTELVTRGEEPALRELYHRSCQLMAVVVLPPALVIAFFSRHILGVWTGNPAIVENAALVLSLLVVGTALNGLMQLPYALQLAYGWTKLGLYANAVAVAVLAPLLFVMASRYGGAGAAAIWVALNSGYLLINIHIMHRRLLPTEKWRWYLSDVGLPSASVLATVALGWWLMPENLPAVATVAWIALVGLAAAGACVLAASEIRRQVLGYLRRYTVQFSY